MYLSLQTETFCLSPTPKNRNIQQLFACVNVNQQPLVYIQHKFLLISNTNFLLTTLLTNHVSRNHFVNYCIVFMSFPTTVYIFATNTTNHSFCSWIQPFLFFPRNHCQQATIQLNFFQQPALQPNFSISIQHFHFIVFFPPLPPRFFGSDVLSADCPSWRGAM